jgi:hypothetical protein
MIKTKPIPALTAEDIRRFWSMVDRREPNECWPWKGPRYPSYIPKGKRKRREGYARFYVNRDGVCHSLKAHRVAMFLTTGKDPGQKFGCHSCDNVICCNGAHLFPGTHRENMDDCIAKGRIAKGDEAGPRKWRESRPRGESNHFHKLTQEQVALLLTVARDAIDAVLGGRRQHLPRGLVAKIQKDHPEVAGICKAQIARVLRRQAWQHTPMPEVVM